MTKHFKSFNGLMPMLLLIFAGFTACRRQSDILAVGYAQPWGTLDPLHLDNAFGVSLMLNEFETLVSVGENGVLIPKLAKSWRVSSDQTSITFNLDENARFSDNSPVFATDVKRAWEDGYRLEDKTHNLAQQPTFRHLKGLKRFATTGEIPGIEVLNERVLKISFDAPVRSVLFGLTDYVFYVHKVVGSRRIGTGPYKITASSSQEVNFVANKYSATHAHFEGAKVLLVPPDRADQALKEGRIEAYFFAPTDRLKSCALDNGQFDCITSQEARREVLVLNGQHESRLSNRVIRSGLQAAFWKALKERPIPREFKAPYFRLDPQVFLPFQAGRLDTNEARALIDEGIKFIEAAKKESAKQPYTIMASSDSSFFEELFKSQDIQIRNPTGLVPSPQKMKALFAKGAPDIVSVFYLIFLGDPGALEHYLSQGGSLASPLAYRKPVSDLLTTAQSITEVDKIDPTYQRISRFILQEVPFIQIGFRANAIVYDQSWLKVNQHILNRTELPLNLLSPK
jgi:hypothetical protein